MKTITLKSRSILAFLLLAVSFSTMAKGKPFADQNKEYHHWANGGTVQTDAQWDNGNLNKQNSTYKEGDVVPHVYTPSGLVAPTEENPGIYSIVINYDYNNTQREAGGFADFVTDPTLTVSPTDFYDKTGIAADGDGYFTKNIKIISISPLTPNGSSGNTIVKRVKVDFIYTGTTGDDAAFYFGLRLATAGEVTTYGAAAFPGSSLDTRLDPNGSQNSGSRTLTINTGFITSGCTSTATANIAAGRPVCDGSSVTVTFTGSGGTAPYTFFYNDPDGNPQSIGSNNDGVATITVTAVGSFTYTLTGVADATACFVLASGSATATIYSNPTAPSTARQDLCPDQQGGNTATFDLTALATTIIGGQTGVTVNWYTTNTNGVLTGSITSYSGVSTTLYAQVVNSTTMCPSGIVTVTLMVKPSPTATLSYTIPACKPVTGTSTVSPKFTPSTGNPFSNVAYSSVRTSGGTGSLSISASTGVINLVLSDPGTYTVTVSFTGQNGCSNTATTSVSLSLCGNSFTQGFWGGTSGTGKDCKGSSLQTILTGLLPITVGSSTRSLRLNDVAKTMAIMPGGSYSQNVFDKKYVLTSPLSGEFTLAGTPFLDSKTGKLVSVVISQTIALALNTKYSSTNGNLGTIAFEAGKNVLQTKALVYGSTTSCDVSSVSATVNSFTMSSNVLCYMQKYSGTYSFNVNGLLKLANDVIGGVIAPSTTAVPFSFSDLVQTLDAINKGFDRGAQLVGFTGSYTCPQNNVTTQSRVDLVESNTVKILSVLASPNPFKDKIRFTIQTPKAGRASLEVYNMLGQKVGVPFEGNLNAGETRNVEYNAPVNNRTNLIYMLRMNGDQVSGKLMSTRQ